MERKNAWKKYSKEQKEAVFAFGEEYKKFISECKTERECVTELIAQAEAAGFEDLNEVVEKGRTIKAGDKLYAENMGKTLALFVIGRQPLEKGMNILGAHIDSPRLDLKQVPLYEDTELALLDTHYYGGVKKYQWVALPLALHGVVVKKDGTKAMVNIGEKETDPVFGISDLLVHLAAEQLEKKASKVIDGENLDLLVGSIPWTSEEEKEKAKEAVKANVLNILKEQYNIGAELLSEKVENIRKIFNKISIQFEDFGVKCLYDTVQKGIPQFLKWYDIKFCPQNTILTFDYPLFIDCSSLTGADAVYKYIRAIQTEQKFLGAFDRNYVMSILEKYNSEYRGMVENICGIVLTNIIGHVAIKKPFNDTGFLYEEYLQISKVFAGKSFSDIENIVKELIKKMVSKFYENDMDMLEYLCCETNNIAVRIFTANQHGQLSKVFVS